MLNRLRDRLDGLLTALARERYEVATGERGASAVGAGYRAAADLFRLDRLSEVQLAMAGATGEEERRARYLLEFLAYGRANCVAADELDAYLAWQAEGRVVLDDFRVGLRGAPWAVASTRDPGARRSLHDAYLAALEEHEDLLEGLLSRRRDALEELGYGSMLATVEVLNQLDVRGLAREAERFVADTESEYRELLAWHLPVLAGVEAGDATEADLLRLERAAPHDALFGGRSLAPRLTGALSGCGLDLSAAGRLRLRTRVELPGGPGASAYPVVVPDQVVLVVSPHAGRPVHAAVLRGLGEALHAAHTAADLPLEYRRLGDPSTTLGYGRLLESLLESPAFLAREYEVPRARLPELLRLSALLLLLRARRQAALLRYEVELLGEAGDPDRGRYAELLTEATGARHDPRGALAAVGPGLGATRALRAELLASVLGEHLRERFDEDWYRNPRTGPALEGLFALGRTFGAPELAVQVSSTRLSFGALRARVLALLG